VLDFMDRVVESPIHLIGNCNELNAGYAADAYARLAPGIWHQTMRGPYNDVYSY
jgi:TPP-dependent 2-oxoacid decarboxylase